MKQIIVWLGCWIGVPVTVCLLRGAPWERLALLAILGAFSAAIGSFILKESSTVGKVWHFVCLGTCIWIWLMAFGVLPIWWA